MRGWGVGIGFFVGFVVNVVWFKKEKKEGKGFGFGVKGG